MKSISYKTGRESIGQANENVIFLIKLVETTLCNKLKHFRCTHCSGVEYLSDFVLWNQLYVFRKMSYSSRSQTFLSVTQV